MKDDAAVKYCLIQLNSSSMFVILGRLGTIEAIWNLLILASDPLKHFISHCFSFYIKPPQLTSAHGTIEAEKLPRAPQSRLALNVLKIALAAQKLCLVSSFITGLFQEPAATARQVVLAQPNPTQSKARIRCS